MADGLNELGMNITIIDACENSRIPDFKHPRFIQNGEVWSGDACLDELSRMGAKILDERDGDDK
jgi:hypothetical protein